MNLFVVVYYSRKKVVIAVHGLKTPEQSTKAGGKSWRTNGNTGFGMYVSFYDTERQQRKHRSMLEPTYGNEGKKQGR